MPLESTTAMRVESPRRQRMRSERGSAAIAAVGVVVLGLVLMVGLAGIGQVVLAREKVVAAAEAGALAAAPVTFRPFGATGSPSAEADRLVRANGASARPLLLPLRLPDTAPGRPSSPRG